MQERVGRARPFIILAPVAAFLLMLVALVVATSNSGRSPAATATPSTAAVGSISSSRSVAATPRLGCTADPMLEPTASAVRVFFDCGGPPQPPRPVTREVPPAASVEERLRLALAALFDGPTNAERARGFAGFLPAGSDEALLGVELRDGAAVIDVSDALTRDALNASHNRFVVFETMGSTIRQFGEIESVEFRVEGSCQAFGAYFESACTFVREREGVLGDWLLVHATVGGDRITTSGVSPLTIVIEPEVLRGQAQCNVFGAPIQVHGESLTLGPIEASEVGCSGDAATAEAAYLRALARVVGARVAAGQLQLTGPGVELRYAELSPVLPGG